MKHALNITFVLVLLALDAPTSVQAQQWLPPIELEIRGGAPWVAGQGFKDGEENCCYGYDWVKDARGQASIAGQVRLPLTSLLIPYMGVHQRRFGERAASDLLQEIYGPDLTREGMPDELTARHLVRGVAVGISVEPEFARVRPVLFAELSRDRFESNTSFAVMSPNGEPEGSRVEGESRLMTKAGTGWAVGGGIRLAGGPFEFRPAIRYVSMAAPVTSRTYEWAEVYDAGGFQGGSGNLTVPAGQEVRARHFEMSVGVSYRVVR